jgi:hypothetical protein
MSKTTRQILLSCLSIGVAAAICLILVLIVLAILLVVG